MKKFTFLIVIVIGLTSCKNKEESLNKAFNETETLTHRACFINSDYLMGSAGKMLIIDSLLVTLDQNNNNFFHFFHIEKEEYIGNYGTKGQGPDEFLQPFSLFYSSPKDFFSYDIFDNSLKKIKIDSLEHGKIYYDKVISFNSIENSLVFPTKYGTYVGFGLYDSNMFKLIDSSGKDIGLFCEFPINKGTASKKIDNRNIALAYQGTLTMNSEKDKLVYAAVYGTILGFYDITGNSINENLLYVYDHPDFTVQNSNGGISSPITQETISAFRDIYPTENYVYTLYSGHKIAELREKAFSAKDIYVYDWQGVPIKHFITDIPINTIAITKDDKKMYAITYNPEPEIVVFDLSI